MKNILLIMILLISFVSMRPACATGWTVEIDNVRVWNSNKAEIIVKNPRSPNPAGTAWNRVIRGQTAIS